MPLFRFLLALCLSPSCALTVHAASQVAGAVRATTVAVLDLGETATARRAADELAAALERERTDGLAVTNRGQARAAARGAGYAGSLNLSLEEARALGAAIGSDFLVMGAADTLRRQSSERPIYFESYASVFVVSSFTGRLVSWEHLSAESLDETGAEREMLAKLAARAAVYAKTIARARAAEREEHKTFIERDTHVVVEDAPEEGSPAAQNFRQPLPYRRLRPDYTAEAARAGAEATVDALVELDPEGEVKSVEIVRWAGYGLDESVARTVRQMHFRPALREGKAVPVRVLLRYNFRRPK